MTNALYMNYRTVALNPIPTCLISGAANNGSGLIRITSATNHGLQTGDSCSIEGVVGVTAANGNWVITQISETTFDLQSSTFSGSYSSGGIILYPDASLKHLGTIVRWGVGNTGASTYGDDIGVALINETQGTYYIPSITAHSYISDVTSSTGGSGTPGPIIARSSALQSKTVSTGSGGTLVGGVANATNVTYTTPGSSGNVITSLIIYKQTGDDVTSTLIGYINVATGLPVTLSGGNLSIVWDTGSNKIYVL